MIYLLAVVGALTIAVLLWKVLASERVGVPSQPATPIAPDDDPEFLRSLDERRKQDE